MCGNVYTSQVAKVLLSIVSKAESIKKMTNRIDLWKKFKTFPRPRILPNIEKHKLGKIFAIYKEQLTYSFSQLHARQKSWEDNSQNKCPVNI